MPQSITLRLHDSLPPTVLEQWREALERLPENQRHTERRKHIDAALDAGHGKCWLRNPQIAQMVEDALLFFDGQRYQLHEWEVMPNHVHVLATPLQGYRLSSILHAWKSFTAKKANTWLNSQDAFWLDEYFDRAIRDAAHFNKASESITHNSVKAGLCQEPAEWLWSSAYRGDEKWAGRPRSQEEASQSLRAGRPRSQEEASQ
ncbi:MAG: transposase [Magnetococcus sp. XQGC-1]